ncbi:DUF427 domain-containing protein [Gordonia sp. CPCC 205515]|uniref:DUF427 domain-containing protein n=1 Tax=Gordonia sp. CPCC 205515 TaxID=3140791 RepID=UPI003AF3EC78
MARQRLEPSDEHPITVSPTGARIVVRVGDVVIADTSAALTLAEANYPPMQYVPLSDVNKELLRDSATTTYCPFKGDCAYYDLVVDGREITDAVWTYREPYPAVHEIAGHVAFYPDHVDVASD